MRFPEAVQSYIERNVIKMRGVAFLEFGGDGGLISWGGNLFYHGVGDLVEGKALGEIAPFLENVMPPFIDGRLVLSQVQAREHQFSDIHFFQAGDSDWVIFLDRTHENRGFQVVQQCFNELALLRDLYGRELEKHRNSPEAENLVGVVENLRRETERLLRDQEERIGNLSCSHIIEALQITVAQRVEGRVFRIENCPRWFEELGGGGVLGATLDLVEAFPFLENFFDDAATVWEGRLPGPLRSGLWVEEDHEGKDVALQATALRHGDDAILLISFPSIDYREKQKILTRARSTELEHEKLRKEIDKKEILLHCIVHDLAGPLHGVQGALELMAADPLAEGHRELVEGSIYQCDTLQRLIKNILGAFAAEVSALQTTEIRPEMAPDVLTMLNDVRGTLGSLFAIRGVELKIVDGLPSGVDRRAAVDGDSFRRALINLVENALWHSSRGDTVTMGVELQGSGILVTVDDQGPGVPDDLRDRLFLKFSQIDREGKGKVGLGLYFCRITAEAWNGEVGQENLPERGSRFWIRFPALTVPAECVIPPVSRALESFKDD